MMKVEVAYALPDKQEVIVLEVERSCTAFAAAELSGIIKHFPEINLGSSDMGVFSQALDGKVLPSPKEYVLEENDRVEIYRPLLIDPKEARALRAKKAKDKKLLKKAKE